MLSQQVMSDYAFSYVFPENPRGLVQNPRGHAVFQLGKTKKIDNVFFQNSFYTADSELRFFLKQTSGIGLSDRAIRIRNSSVFVEIRTKQAQKFLEKSEIFVFNSHYLFKY